MTTSTAMSAWTDAAANGTLFERALLAAGRWFTHAAARSARRRSERHDACASFSDDQRERMRARSVVWGVLRR